MSYQVHTKVKNFLQAKETEGRFLTVCDRGMYLGKMYISNSTDIVALSENPTNITVA